VNSHNPERKTINVSKVWDDNNNQDGARPESITVRLRANGAETASRTVSAATEWKCSFEDVPVYENGKPVYEGESVKTISVETVRYRNLPNKHASPAPRRQRDGKNPKKK
jgi:hypothetical protein